MATGLGGIAMAGIGELQPAAVALPNDTIKLTLPVACDDHRNRPSPFQTFGDAQALCAQASDEKQPAREACRQYIGCQLGPK